MRLIAIKYLNRLTALKYTYTKTYTDINISKCMMCCVDCVCVSTSVVCMPTCIVWIVCVCVCPQVLCVCAHMCYVDCVCVCPHVLCGLCLCVCVLFSCLCLVIW